MTTITERMKALDADLGAADDDVTSAATFLVAAAYDGRDRDVWGGDRALSFWDRFPDRIRAACYRGPTLGHWWDAISHELGATAPTRVEDRKRLAQILVMPADPVRSALTGQTQALCLRVRLAWQLTRETKESTK